MTTVANQIVCVGDCLGSTASFAPGQGTSEDDGQIFASVVGKVAITDATTTGELPSISVQRTCIAHVPVAGQLVTARVTRVTPRVAAVDILCIGTQPLHEPFNGVIRSQDVRATAIDSVVLADCFRPGDIVAARVLAAGDARSFYLTTAQDNLGVLTANSAAGVPMVATSTTEMRCPETEVNAKRKVAQDTTA